MTRTEEIRQIRPMNYRQIKSSNKFKAKRQDYGGKWYHSKGEAAYAEELDWKVKAGEIKSWEGQVKIPLDVNGVHITNYYVDFRVIDKYGGVSYHEYKGFETPEWRMKWALFTALLPEIDPGAELVVIKHQSFYKTPQKL